MKMKKLKYKKERVTVVIPAHNEEKSIKKVIQSVKKYCDNVLVVMSKKTKDKTKEISRSLGVEVIVDNGLGKGEGMRCAIDQIDDGVIVFIDADGSHIAKDIPQLVIPIIKKEADMVIASRFLGGSEEFVGDLNKFLRVVFGMGIALVVNWRFKSSISDTQNGFRAISAKAAKALNLTSNHTEVETEMCMKCLKKHYRISDIPSRELKREYGSSNIVLWKHGWQYAWTTIKNLF
jgi:glycosyltransferase involved in cell wall biosynthesis